MLTSNNNEQPAVSSSAPPSVPLWLKAFGAFSVLCLAALAVTHLAPSGRLTDGLVTVLDDPALAFTLAALLFAWSQSRGVSRTVWGLFALGAASWLVGELLFEIRYALGTGSGASVADVFYLLFYPPVMAALFVLGRGDRRERRAGQSLDIAIVMGAVALVLWVLVWQTELSATGDATTQAINIAYSALDFGVLWMLVLPVFRSDVRWSRSRNLMAFAFSGILVADTIWVATPTELYGLIASTSLLLLGIAAVRQPDLTQYDPSTTSRHRLLREVGVVGAGAIAVSLLVWQAVRNGVAIDLALSTSALLALVLSQLLMSLSQNDRLLRESELRASTDPLTGLLNHGSFHEHLDRELSRARRDGAPLALVFVDLDHLKSVNDLAGHRVGDRVLGDLANSLRATCRDTDLVCRTGGDEMAVIAPATSLAQAGELAGRLLRAAGSIHVDGLGVEMHMSLSLGVSEFPALAADKLDLIAQADAALYAAKQGGRGRWCAFDPKGGRRSGTQQQLDRARAQVAAGESDFRAVFTHALEPMVITDENTTIFDVNDAAVQLAGVPRESLIGQDLSRFVRDSDSATMPEILERLRVSARERGEIRATLPSGSHALIEFAASRFSPTRYLVGLRDITDSAEAQHELAFSESRFRALFDSNLDAIFITDDDGVILDANPAAATMAERSKPELVGMLASDLAPPENQDVAEANRTEFEREGTLNTAGVFVDPSGRRRVLEYSSVADFVPGQHLSVVRDITDREQPSDAPPIRTGPPRA